MSTHTRKQLTALIIIILTALFVTNPASNNMLSKSANYSLTHTLSTSTMFTVTHVVDGDTIDIDNSGERIRLRLIGINSPESVDPRRPVECFGKEASRYASSVLGGQRVSIALDLSQGEFDKYGRTLAYVFLSDGTSFNQLMIKEGYAYEYTYHTAYHHQKDFQRAQEDARQHERGLWSPTTCAGMR